MTEGVLKVRVISAESMLYEGAAQSVVFPGSVFPFEVLKDHAPIITTLQPGKIVLKHEDAAAEEIVVKSGVVRVDNNEIIACVEV